MSTEAMLWVAELDGEVRPPAPLVSTLLALANCVAPDMSASPETQYLTRFTKLDDSELYETLGWIENLGLAVWAGTTYRGTDQWLMPVGAASVDDIAAFATQSLAAPATTPVIVSRVRATPAPTAESIRAAWRDTAAARGTAHQPAPEQATAAPKRSARAPREEPKQNLAPDVTRLCEHLATCITRSGGRKRQITAKWRNDMRLLIDDVTELVKANDPATPPDRRREVAVTAITDTINAAFDDPFWYSHILSPGKLREKYEPLKALKGRNGNGRARQSTATGPVEAHGRIDDMFTAETEA